MDKGYLKQIDFENGYGLSIISHEFSYGGSEGLFEIALIDPVKNELLYDPDLGFADVLGFLDFAEVVEVIERVKNFPARIEEQE